MKIISSTMPFLFLFGLMLYTKGCCNGLYYNCNVDTTIQKPCIITNYTETLMTCYNDDEYAYSYSYPCYKLEIECNNNCNGTIGRFGERKNISIFNESLIYSDNVTCYFNKYALELNNYGLILMLMSFILLGIILIKS